MNWLCDPSWGTLIALMLATCIAAQIYSGRWDLVAITCGAYLAGVGARRATEWYQQRKQR